MTTPFDRGVVEPECDIDCGQDGCPSGQHNAWETVPAFMAWMRNGGVHSSNQCENYTCDVRHGPFCGYWDTEELEALQEAVASGGAATVAEWLAAHEDATLNADRSAVQVVDCRGAIVVHLPLPIPLVRSIAAVLRPVSTYDAARPRSVRVVGGWGPAQPPAP